MSRPLDLAGKRFGRLVALRVVGTLPNGKYTLKAWLTQCDCGGTTVVRSSDLKSGHTSSCGCLSPETTTARNFKHGKAVRGERAPEHSVWAGMVDRCTNTRGKNWEQYGGRGVTVDPRWLGSAGFANFLADMGPRPENPPGWSSRMPHWQLDRIDNDGPYSPGNCRWATASEQRLNQRRQMVTHTDRSEEA